MTTTIIGRHHYEELTPEEEDLYCVAFCFYRGHKIEHAEEHESHLCAAKQALKSYYKEEDFS